MATVYLNAATGNDSNTYAQAQNPATPWLTPGKVNTSATTGDSVVMAAGTYTFASVTFSKSFTWVGAALANGLPTTIFNGAAAVVSWSMYGTSTISNVLFQNTLSKNDNSPDAIFVHKQAVAGLTTFSNCVFKSITSQATTGKGGLCSIGSAASSFQVGFIFNNCVFINPIILAGTAGYLFGVDNVSQGSFQSFTLTNCTFYFSTSGVTALVGVHGLWNAHNATLKNCIYYNATGGTLKLRYDNTIVLTMSYCDNYLMTNAPAGTGNITSDPLFVDAENGNFNLRPTSPCLDTGSL